MSLLDRLIDKHGPPAPNSRVGIFMRREGVRESYDYKRINELPRRDPDAIIPDLSPLYVRTDANCSGCDLCRNGPPKLKPLQNRLLLEAERCGGAIGPMPVGAGKCVSGDTQIFDPVAGRMRLARESGKLHVVAMTPEGRLEIANAVSFPSGNKPCLRIILCDGKQITLSVDHPIFTPKGWIRADAVKGGDLVAEARHMPAMCSSVLTDGEIKLLGYMLADGCLRMSTPEFTDDNSEVLKDVISVVEVLGGRARDKHSTGCGKATTLSISGLNAFFKKHGIWGILSKHRSLPTSLLELSNRQLALLLNCMWSCDGHLAEDKPSLEMTLASEKLIDAFAFLLIRLGIRSNKRYKKASYVDQAGKRKVFDAWRTSISGKDDVLRFLDIVGDLRGQEAKCRRVREALADVVSNTNLDIVPLSVPEVHEICDEHARPGERSKIHRTLGATRGQLLGRNSFASWCKASGYVGKYRWLADNDLRWVKIDRIEDAGVIEVFDLSVPSHGCFVGNGIVLHNTLSALLLPDAMGSKRAVILVPAQLKDQLVRVDIPRYSRHFTIHTDRIQVVSYSELSIARGARLLSTLRPDLIICDEAHSIKRRESARTKRVMRYLEEEPACRFVGMSGTVTSRSLRDYAHLARRALRAGAPVPFDWGVLAEWCAALDERVEIRTGAGILLGWATEEERKGDELTAARAGFRRRLLETPGIVASASEEVGASLILSAHRFPFPPVITQAFGTLEALWTTPDGIELEDPMAYARVARQLAQGFYYVWRWPKGEPDQEWLDARNAWAKACRNFLKSRSKEGLDSPLLLANAIMRGDLKGETADAWFAWAKVKQRPEPPVEPVWLDDSLPVSRLEALADLVREGDEKGTPFIVWYEHRAVGELLQSKGIPTFGAGQNAEVAQEAAKGKVRTVALSVPAHGTGKNLQSWSRAVVLCPPSSGTRWEQLCGRLHRPGQLADEVRFAIDSSSPEFQGALVSCLEQARYVEQTQGAKQRALYATRIGWPGE